MQSTGSKRTLAFALALLVPLAGPAVGAEPKKRAKKPKTAAPKSALDFKVKSIDGKDVDLRKLKNRVVMVVNVASQ